MHIIIWLTYWRLNVSDIFFINNWKRNIKKVKAVCSCWTECIVDYQSLKNWWTKSCWCLRNKLSSDRMKLNVTHWKTYTRFYKIYMNILWRTRDKTNHIYWAKWIWCEWDSFESFKKDMYDSYVEHCNIYWEKATSIDRIDSKLNYCKDNCRWSTPLVQSNNTSRNRMITYLWRTQSLALWCKEFWLNYYTIRSRIYILWKSPEEAFTY